MHQAVPITAKSMLHGTLQHFGRHFDSTLVVVTVLQAQCSTSGWPSGLPTRDLGGHLDV